MYRIPPIMGSRIQTDILFILNILSIRVKCLYFSLG